MKPSAKLQLQHGRLGVAEAREALLAGLVENDGAFVKQEEEEAVIPLRFGANKKKEIPQPQPRASAQNGVVMVDPDDDLDGYEDGDELIDEDELLSEEDLKRPPQQRKPVEIVPFSRIHDANLCSPQRPSVPRNPDKRSDDVLVRTAHAASPRGFKQRTKYESRRPRRDCKLSSYGPTT
jgi:hypothetical protein